MKREKRLRLIEFLIIGIFMGVVEDILAIFIATDAVITPHVVWIVIAVAIPFAFLSEIVVDHPRFWEKLIPVRHSQDKGFRRARK